MENGPHVVPESTLVAVCAGKLVSQELGPELLEDLVGEVGVAELQSEVALDRVVIATDELVHRRLADRAGRVRVADRRPTGGEVGQVLARHRSRPFVGTGHGSSGPVSTLEADRGAEWRFTWNLPRAASRAGSSIVFKRIETAHPCQGPSRRFEGIAGPTRGRGPGYYARQDSNLRPTV